MTDILTPEQRSKRMSLIRSSGTQLELRLAAELVALRFKFTQNEPTLPGKPDFVFFSRRVAVFVHGCFWHGHSCRGARLPLTNQDYWSNKINNNRSRDRRVARQLRDLGWTVLTIWECRIRSSEDYSRELRRIKNYLARKRVT